MNRLTVMRQFLLSTVVGLALMGCTQNQVDPADQAPSATIQAMRASFGSLEGNWLLSNYKHSPLPASQQNRATLVLTKQADDALQLGGRSFINHYGGSFSLDETKGLLVSTDPLISTKMGGSTEDMQAEITYYNLLTKVTYFELTSDGQLVLYTGPKEARDTEVLYFTKK